MTVRAKMRLQGVISNSYGGWKALFSCEYDKANPEDVAFCKATPTGQAEFTIDNPDAMNQLVIGKCYYFDISEVPAVQKAA